MSLIVKVKKLRPYAVKPVYSKIGDAGLDLVATGFVSVNETHITYGTDLAFEIPEGYVGLIFPRSSIRNYTLSLANSVGVIDSGYRGEVQVTFNKIPSERPVYYNQFDKIAQMIILPYPQIALVETEELSQTERGVGGFGSTGK